MMIFYILEIIIFSYFFLNVIYILVHAIAGLFYKEPQSEEASDFLKIRILIPGYKEDRVIISTALEALKQEYPKGKFEVIIIADQFEKSTINQLLTLPVKLIEVDFEESTKVKSLNKALHLLNDNADIAVILDADNVMDKGFLKKTNNLFHQNILAAQSNRTAKNTNTPFALLDALTECINNNIFRKGFYSLGQSSAIIGSGMAFNYHLFKNIIKHINAVGGFDRELQLKIVESGVRIHYIASMKVYDEKVEKARVYHNQRTRWISSQYHYLVKHFANGIKSFFNGNFDYFKFSIVTNLFLPQILSFSIFVIINISAFFLSTELFIPVYFYIFLLLLNITSFLLAIPKRFYRFKTLAAIGQIPVAFIMLIMSLFKVRKGNRTFIHTPHANVNVNYEGER